MDFFMAIPSEVYLTDIQRTALLTGIFLAAAVIVAGVAAAFFVSVDYYGNYCIKRQNGTCGERRSYSLLSGKE